MFIDHQIMSKCESNDWAFRSESWISDAAKIDKKRKRRERNSQPLILCGHGMSLKIDKGCLVIRDGFTHYPQQQNKYRFFRGDLELPPRILLLDGSGTLSFDVLSWLSEQGVALARICWNGGVATVASGSGFVSDRAKVNWQHEVRIDSAKRLAFAIDLISQKLSNSVATLQSCLPLTAAIELAIGRAQNGITRLQQPVGDMSQVRAIEGASASAYFAAFQAAPLQWTGTERHPIPDDWRTYLSRSSLTSGKVPKNRMASHPLNAMMNYAYTVRQAQLQIQAIADGYDPTLGIMHNAHQGSAAYILDLIEPERPKVDAAILRFIQGRKFAAADFIIRTDGVCRLSPQLARMIATLV